MKHLAFYRSFHGFTGGHLKIWDYYCHIKHSYYFRPTVYLTPESLLGVSNPWVAAGEPIEHSWDPRAADALFLGGLDWLSIPNDCSTPVINLVQGLRHSDPSDARYGFLSRRAVRICVSQPVADAVLATGQANGPVLTIPAGVDPNAFPKPATERDIHVLIVGLKQPVLAAELSATLANRAISNVCLKKALPRQEFLSLLGRATVTIFLPLHQEGFYLPALEGMAMGTLVVCPDCIGNRQYCVPGTNCLQPDYMMDAMAGSVSNALRLSEAERQSLAKLGYATSEKYSLKKEAQDVREVLKYLNVL